MPLDWFRQPRWSSAIAAEFEARLRRSRPTGRAQYLRIQGATLLEAVPPDYATALALLDRVVTEYRAAELEQPIAHTLRGQCAEGLGDVPAALAAYRAAMAIQRVRPTVRTDAYARFALLVLSAGRRELFAEAADGLATWGPEAHFPVERFRADAARALLADAQGDRAGARAAAQRALAAAAERTSGLPQHPDVGLVGDSAAPWIARLRIVAAV